MRFFLIFTKKSVPQWQQCYYDYTDVKSLIILSKKAYAIKCNIQDLAREDNYALQQDVHLVENKEALDHIKISKFDKIQQVIKNANILFYQYHQINKIVVFTFLQFKIHQLSDRVDNYLIWNQYAVQTKSLITNLLSNCYAQKAKLQIMSQLHIQAFQKVHKKHLKTFKPFGFTTPDQKSKKIGRSILTLKKFSDKLKDAIDKHQQVVQRQKKYRIEQQIQASPFKISVMSYLFGLCNGFSICVLITAVVLLGINLGADQLLTQNLTQDQVVFLNQYRLWKSTGFIILYMWVFAISLYIFQKKRMNFNLIFGYEGSNEKSTGSLGVATFFLLIWSCFIIFYIMDLVGIYPASRVSENPITIFFPAILFGLFIISFIIEFIRNRQAVLFFLFTLSKIVLSIFGCYEITFGVIWATQQMISLVQLIFDLSYSICYYSVLLPTPSTLTNSCLNLKIIPQCVVITLYAIRSIQCLRIGFAKRQFLGTEQMYRLIRASIYITLAGLSLGAQKQKYNVLWFWGFLGFFSAIYAFIIDVLLDWRLFNMENKKRLRRQYNIFSIRTINFMIAINFIARFSFLITFCPNIIFTYVPNPEVVISIAGVIQLGRRLIWNLLRVQNEQVNNNYHFQIRVDYQTQEKKITDEIMKKKASVLRKNRLSSMRTKKQLDILRDLIRYKDQIRDKVRQFCKQNNQTLQEIEDSAEKQIFNLVGAIK